MDWWVMRIVVSEAFRGTSPNAVRYQWSYADSLEAHLTLDALDQIRILYRPELPKKRGKHG